MQLQLSKEKCQFGVFWFGVILVRVNFSGTVLLLWEEQQSRYTLRLQSFPKLACVIELQRFIRQPTITSMHGKHFGNRPPPPPHHKLLKRVRWIMDEGCQAASEDLRARLTNDPVTLAHPVWNSEFMWCRGKLDRCCRSAVSVGQRNRNAKADPVLLIIPEF